jgi:hypothetical protein
MDVVFQCEFEAAGGTSVFLAEGTELCDAFKYFPMVRVVVACSLECSYESVD